MFVVLVCSLLASVFSQIWKFETRDFMHAYCGTMYRVAKKSKPLSRIIVKSY